MLKLIIAPKSQSVDEGFGSQDPDQFLYDDKDKEIEDFEKSLVKFEDEFKENQSALKSLCKKITPTTSKKPCEKVSNFFKPKDLKEKKMQTRNEVLTETQAIKSENVIVTTTDKDTLGKRPNPSLSKKITSTTSEKPCEKVSNFFKPKDLKEKKMQTRNNILTENQAIKSENVIVTATDKDTSGKRPNPFSK